MRKKRPGRQYPRGAVYKENQALVWERAGGVCEVTLEDLFIFRAGKKPGTWESKRKWACHHVIAERFVRLHFKGISPHIVENMVAIVPSLHSRITAAEAKLMKADWLGYRQALNRLGFPLELLDQAWGALCRAESVKNSLARGKES